MKTRNSQNPFENSEIVQFLRQKDFIKIREVGSGGTGTTVLLRDPIISEDFVCKKFTPIKGNDSEDAFERFISEIKFLHLAYHPNVVRVFNYYLYPRSKTGYIFMEYVDGEPIDDYLKINPDKVNDLFVQAIEGFSHLEKLNLLHRDIKPANILVSKNGELKIIDFGFSKIPSIEDLSNRENSLMLNWPYSLPNECYEGRYNLKSEIYFLGKLFERIIHDLEIEDFFYSNILESMVEVAENSRIESFSSIQRMVIEEKSHEIEFTPLEKLKYQKFSDEISPLVTKIYEEARFDLDNSSVQKKMKNVYQNSILETKVFNISDLISCFILGGFWFKSKSFMDTKVLIDFYDVFESSSVTKKKVILNNLYYRLQLTPKYQSPNKEDELPF